MKADDIHEEGESEVLTLDEAAKRLKTSYSTVYRLVVCGELEAFRLRNAWRTSTLACDRFVKRQFEEQAIACKSIEVE